MPILTQPPATRFLTSWSGGKDSALALWRASQAGGQPTGLLTMLAESGERSRSHGLPPTILQAQAAALGLPLVCGVATWSGYEAEWTAKARQLADQTAATQVVFGDIDLDDHRIWEERVCTQIGLSAHLPLWQQDRLRLVEEMFELGMQTMIVSARADCADLLGEILNPAVVHSLVERGADACGENGEYHTCMLWMPNFSHQIDLHVLGREVSPEGYHFLQVECATSH
ncbi:MAG: adenosine nucleotide hydrolase [Pseudomonadota bacterium]|nr:adenosine nucleotide hydrolase [Pseudomonadota bacterium]